MHILQESVICHLKSPMRYLLPLCVTCRPAGIRTLQLRIHSLVDLLIHNAERINAIPMGGPHVGDDLTLVGACGVRWSLVTLPTFWSLVTLPTSLGRVASDPLMFFLWPCSLKNTSHRILFLVVACDPTYLFGRVASDHFLALPIPKHLP